MKMRKPPVGPDKCSKCGAESPCVDWGEVDIGVGVQCFDYRYACPTHGEFGYPNRPRDPNKPSVAIFRNEPEEP
jgi:hypothetical protein